MTHRLLGATDHGTVLHWAQYPALSLLALVVASMAAATIICYATDDRVAGRYLDVWRQYCALSGWQQPSRLLLWICAVLLAASLVTLPPLLIAGESVGAKGVYLHGFGQYEPTYQPWSAVRSCVFAYRTLGSDFVVTFRDGSR
jgi:hypothetical protein